jgi:hypothetical protein
MGIVFPIVVCLNLTLINCNVKNNLLLKYWLIEGTSTGILFNMNDTCQIYKKYSNGKEGMLKKSYFEYNENNLTIDSIKYDVSIINQKEIILINKSDTLKLIEDIDQESKIDYINRIDILTK